jgi:predicted PurR-regulated permease PerM
MNSNKLTPHHLHQLIICILLFVVFIVAAAWIYSSQFKNVVPKAQTVNDQQNLSNRLAKPGSFTPEEEKVLNARLKSASTSTITQDDGRILSERLKKR